MNSRKEITLASESLYGDEYESLFLKFLGNTPQLRLIDFFMDNPLLDFTKKEIMEHTGMAKRTFYEYFPIIEKQDIVKIARKIGRAKLYKINKNSDIVKKLRTIERILSMSYLDKEIEFEEDKTII